MKCPLCNTEMIISASGYVVNQGQVSVKQTFSCRNKNCGNYGKAVKSIYIPLSVREDNEAPTEVEESE